MKIIVETCRAH